MGLERLTYVFMCLRCTSWGRLFVGSKNTPTVLCGIILFLCADTLLSDESRDPRVLPEATRFSESDPLKGYTDIVQFRDTFIAVGTDGRIDRIARSGERASVDRSTPRKLNHAFANDELCIAVGDHGAILYSTDGEKFYHADSGTEKNIHGIAHKNGLTVAGADEGIILISTDARSWGAMQTGAKGNILSISANDSFFMGITDAGEIIKSLDGTHWDIQDYNREYAGYHEYATFKKILTTPNNIVIIGTHTDGSPAILYSSLGNVWAERWPVYDDDCGTVCYLTHKPNNLTYDADRDRFILACDRGELFSLPDCKKCNAYAKISQKDLHAILYADHYLVVAGDDFTVFVEKL